MQIERSDDLNKEIYNFKVVHGTAGVHYLYQNGFRHVPNISKDIRVVMITNKPNQNPYNQIYLNNPDKLNLEYIVLKTKKFRCGIDLIEPLLNYIKRG